jgi:hypothetical protein
MERNEAYERQLFRQQEMKEALDVEYIIRTRAEDERRRMEDQHLRALDSRTADHYGK